MAVYITDHIIANVCVCECGGPVDAVYDPEAGGWYALCADCYETGPTLENVDDAVHCYPIPKEIRRD